MILTWDIKAVRSFQSEAGSEGALHTEGTAWEVSWRFGECSVSSLFSCQVVSDSLQPHGLQHARAFCPSLSPGGRQGQVHWISDAIQPSHPLSSPSPPALNLSQHQSLFQWVSSHQVAKVLELQLSISPSNDYSGLISFRIDSFDLLAVQEISLQSSPASQFESINSLALCRFYGPALTSVSGNCILFSVPGG